MARRLRFSELDWLSVTSGPGIYEIHLHTGVALKVGVSRNLLARLLDHKASRQSGLKLKPGGSWMRPEDVASKKSILAKHLFFDMIVAPDLDLTTQDGRIAFLDQRCFLLVSEAATIEDAKQLERSREKSGEFRYLGRVRVRKRDS